MRSSPAPPASSARTSPTTASSSAWTSWPPTTSPAASVENVPEAATWIEGDLRDADFVRSLWDGGRFDYVYHLGAYAAEGLSHFIRAYNYRTNLEASVNLINHAVLDEVQRFVFTSSIAVYGAGRSR